MTATLKEEAPVFANPVADSGIREEKATYKSVLKHLGICFAVLVFIFLSYRLIKPTENAWYGTSKAGLAAKLYGYLLMLIPLGIGVYLFFKKKLTTERLIWLLLIIGLLLHVAYMLYTYRTVRQHDTWSSNGNGHFDYANYIYKYWTLPTEYPGTDTISATAFTEANIYQFYHPPLSYFIQACWMKVFNVIGGADLTGTNEDLYASCQILSCFYTFLISYYIIKALRLTNLSRPAFILASCFAIFFPRLIQLSGQLNNDDLAILFTVLCVYRVVKWMKEGRSYKDFLLAGLYLGLAMMAKLSAVTVALGLAVLFLMELIKSIKKKEGALPLKKIIIEYVLFIAICAPLGLWFQVYSHNVYGIPYNFVFRNLNSALFTGPRSYVIANSEYYSLSYYDKNNSGLIYTNGFYNFFMRYISPFYIPDLAYNPIYANAFNNYNVLNYAIKSAIFGEFYFTSIPAGVFAAFAVLSAYACWFSVLVSVIYKAIKKSKFGEDGTLSLLLCASIIFFYLYLQVTMPFGCSMDFRYIVVIIMPLAFLVGQAYDNKKEIKTVTSSVLSNLVMFSAGIMLVSSNISYMFGV